MDGFLTIAFVFLIAGVVAVPLATRFGLGSVLGYLIAGIVIAPVLAVLHADVIALQHFAEFGVVIMLFLVGLELEPRRLWDMRAKLLGLGGGLINRMLLNAGHNTVVIDHSSEQLEQMRTFGLKVFFGDASRPELLHAAGIEKAKLLIVAIDDHHQATEIVPMSKRTTRMFTSWPGPWTAIMSIACIRPGPMI